MNQGDRGLPKVTTQSSKAEEMAALEIIVSQCEPGSYLGSFFTEDLVKELNRRIKDDWSSDIYADSLAITQESIARAQKVSELTRQFAEQEAKYQSQIDNMAEAQRQLHTELENCENLRAQTQVDLNRVWNEKDALDISLAGAEIEITKLKARLFDVLEV